MVLGTVAYRLISCNDKGKHQIYALFINLGRHQVDSIPQLFALFSENTDVMLLAIKIVDDILQTGTDDELRRFIRKFNDLFELGEVVNAPEKPRFYRMNLIQYEHSNVSILADYKLQAIEKYPV